MNTERARMGGVCHRAAGMAVVGNALGLVVSRVAIRVETEKQPTALCEFAPPAIDEDLERRAVNLAVAVLAGSAAMVRFRDLGESPSIVAGYPSDRRRAVDALAGIHAAGRELFQAVERAEHEAGKLVGSPNHWPWIERLADVLYVAKSLTGSDLAAAIAGQFIVAGNCKTAGRLYSSC